MRAILTWLPVLGFLIGGLCAEDGISAEIVPSQVRPGDLFELRVVMERSEYGRFDLMVPAHGHLHRVAVEKVPVRLEDGLYRQSETWLLQADSSGEFVIEKGAAMLETKAGTVEVKLDPLRVEVEAYAGIDESSEPLELPEVKSIPSTGKQWAGSVAAIIVLSSLVFWMLKSKRTGVANQVTGKPEVDLALGRLTNGQVDEKDFERLMLGRQWSAESRQAMAEVVYGGRSIDNGLVERLRKEVGP
jgi:hypothetical protein